MKKLLICMICLFLTACFGGRSEQAAIYQLTQVPPAQTYQTAPISVLIDTVRIPTTIDRPQIITVDADGIQLRVNEMARWAEPLSSMIRQTLADDMSAYLPKASVKASAGPYDTFNDTVSLEIVRFWGTNGGGTIMLEAWWNIQNPKGNATPSQKTVLTAQTDASYDEMIKTQSRLIGELAGIISQKLAHK